MARLRDGGNEPRADAPIHAVRLVLLLAALAAPAALRAQDGETATPGIGVAEAAPLAAVHTPYRFAVLLPPRLDAVAYSPHSHVTTAADPIVSLEDQARQRNDAMLNGALIVVGALGVIDNIVVHWILGWHRIVEDHPHALELEIAAVAASTALLATGIIRERRARRR
jgi:hypothetical protein